MQKSPWFAISVALVFIVGLGLISPATRRIAIIIALALILVITLKKFHG